ncbi:MAG TPA: alpha/beta fold hydrolase [Actinomycetes bacterium]|nr:alpha/beta fold hydrolase [Actinomycetes bacterium]
MTTVPTDEQWPVDDWWEPQPIEVADHVNLAVRVRAGEQRPVVMVHGLASNALLWHDVAEAVHVQGHAVAVVDLRGHGRSDRPPNGHDTATAAADLVRIVETLGWVDRRAVIAGQSWGANVAIRAAAESDLLGGVLAVDGGWIHLSDRFPDFDECWRVLAPPGFGDRPPGAVLELLRNHTAGWPEHSLAAIVGNLEVVDGRVRNRLALEHHKQILKSMWDDDPAVRYPRVKVPVHLMVAGRSESVDVDKAAQMIGDSTVSWHPDAHHDVHLQHPELVAERALQLVSRVQGSAQA